jgi:hypothetical protein
MVRTARVRPNWTSETGAKIIAVGIRMLKILRWESRRREQAEQTNSEISGHFMVLSV